MSPTVDTALEVAVRRERVVVAFALGVVVVFSWVYLLTGAGMGMSALEMTRLSRLQDAGEIAGMAMMTPAVWTPGYAVLMLFMWWVMMVAMMLPSAAPMVLLFATVNRRQQEAGRPSVATCVFATGYLAAWAAFSLVAVALQWGFDRTGVLSPSLVGTNVTVGGALLFAAGVYQLTPFKHACLRHCRSPLSFLGTHWRRGVGGALHMGLVHGAFCVGCCWFLMGLLFFGGVMNLFWITGLALLVLLEKVVRAGHWLGYVSGIVLLLWGVTVLAS